MNVTSSVPSTAAEAIADAIGIPAQSTSAGRTVNLVIENLDEFSSDAYFARTICNADYIVRIPHAASAPSATLLN